MLGLGAPRGALARAVPRAAPALGAAACLVALALAAACAGGAAEGRSSGTAGGTGDTGGHRQGDLVVRRGTFEERFLLSGELVAREAAVLSVPRTRTWQMQIRWLERDGTEVAAGARLVDLDNSAFVAELEDRRLRAEQAAHDLARLEMETAAAAAEKEFAVEKQHAEVERARLQAEIPDGLLAEREMQDRRLALARAEAEHAKAVADLETHALTSAADLALKRLELDRERREIAAAERAIAALSLAAPRAGVVVVGNHPWQRRKLQAGDTVWVGLPLVTLPDLSTMAVEAVLHDVDDGRVRPGMPVVCFLDAYPGERFGGRVAAVAPMAREEAEGSPRRFFRVAVDLERIDRERMRPGLSARVEVLARRHPGALLAPRAGLDLAGQAAASGAPGARGAAPPRPRARLAGGGERPVRLGPCGPHDCVVLEGLAAGERLRGAGSAG